MTDNAIIVASCDHRVRFRIPCRRNDALYFEKVARTLFEHPDVKDVKTNSVSASVLVQFNENHCLEAVISFALKKRLFKAGKADDFPSVGEMIWRHAQQFDVGLETLTRGRLNTENLMFLFFLALGVVQLKRGQIMQPAIPLLWRAMSLLRQIHEDENDHGLVGGASER